MRLHLRPKDCTHSTILASSALLHASRSLFAACFASPLAAAPAAALGSTAAEPSRPSISPSVSPSAISAESRFQRLRTASSVRPGNSCAITRHFWPCRATPSMIAWSSSADHSLRPIVFRTRPSVAPAPPPPPPPPTRPLLLPPLLPLLLAVLQLPILPPGRCTGMACRCEACRCPWSSEVRNALGSPSPPAIGGGGKENGEAIIPNVAPMRCKSAGSSISASSHRATCPGETISSSRSPAAAACSRTIISSW